MNEKEVPNYYAIIPASVRYDKTLIPNAKLLYGEITALCNKEGYCWAGNEYFSELYAVNKGTISTWIGLLVKRNYLTCQMIYKEGSKEILHRYLRINVYPMVEIMDTPMVEIMKDNTTGINNTNNNTMPSKAQIKAQEQFSIFYASYPKKTNKTDAQKTFYKLIKSGITLDYILSKLKSYEKTIRDDNVELKYIRNPQRFLNTLEDYTETVDAPDPVRPEAKKCTCGGEIVSSICKNCGKMFDARGEEL